MHKYSHLPLGFYKYQKEKTMCNHVGTNSYHKLCATRMRSSQNYSLRNGSLKSDLLSLLGTLLNPHITSNRVNAD